MAWEERGVVIGESRRESRQIVRTFVPLCTLKSLGFHIKPGGVFDLVLYDFCTECAL